MSLEELYQTNNPYDFTKIAKTLFAAGDTTYDIHTCMDRFMFTNTIEGMYYATSELPYVDITQE